MGILIDLEGNDWRGYAERGQGYSEGESGLGIMITQRPGSAEGHKRADIRLGTGKD
jgi:hypothetical protein